MKKKQTNTKLRLKTARQIYIAQFKEEKERLPEDTLEINYTNI